MFRTKINFGYFSRTSYRGFSVPLSSDKPRKAETEGAHIPFSVYESWENSFQNLIEDVKRSDMKDDSDDEDKREDENNPDKQKWQ